MMADGGMVWATWGDRAVPGRPTPRLDPVTDELPDGGLILLRHPRARGGGGRLGPPLGPRVAPGALRPQPELELADVDPRDLPALRESGGVVGQAEPADRDHHGLVVGPRSEVLPLPGQRV